LEKNKEELMGRNKSQSQMISDKDTYAETKDALPPVRHVRVKQYKQSLWDGSEKIPADKSSFFSDKINNLPRMKTIKTGESQHSRNE